MTKEMNGDFTEPPAYNNLALIKTNDLDTTKSKPQATHASTSTTTVIVQQTHPISYGPKPQPIECPSCKRDVWTEVKSRSSIRTHLMAFRLSLFCCCCLPFCMNSCKNQHHSCPTCETYLGTYAGN